MKYALNYGLTEQYLHLPDTADVSVLAPLPLPPLEDLPQRLQAALEKPLGCPPLGSRPRPQSIAIAVPDETRPLPLKEILPPLLRHINTLWPGFAASQLSILVGGGLHQAADQAQCARILPPEAFKYRVTGHDALRDECLCVGTTSRGNRVCINAAFMRADCKIVIGQIDPHQFVGFTGGAKGVVIGCGAKSTIEFNHALMTQTHAKVGEVDNNPVRQDLNEAGEMLGLDLAINVVLNAHKEPVALLAGSPGAVLAAGYPLSAKVYGLELQQSFDLAIASCGGHPKDICLYQAQKGLNLASHCLRDGGRLILLAACPQGIGDEKYAHYVRQFRSPEQQVAEFTRTGFRMGAHKAFLFSKSLLRCQVGLVSELDAATLAQCMLQKVTLQNCVDRWLCELSAQGARSPRIALIPNANTTFFLQASGAVERVPASPPPPLKRTKQESTMVTHFVVHEPDDSVGVIVLEGITQDQELNGWIMDGDKSISFTTKDDIPIGHKIALKDMAVGDTVIKYGTDIGKVVKPIKQGEHLHVHNVKTKRW